MDRALKVDPNGLGLWEVKAGLAVNEKGDLSVAEEALTAMNSLPVSSNEQKIEIAIARKKLLLLLRKYGELLRGVENIPDDLFGSMPGTLGDKYYSIGIARKALHDETAAQTAFLKAKTIPRSNLNKALTTQESTCSQPKCLPASAKKRLRSSKRNAQGSYSRRAKTPLADRKLRLRWPRFMQSLATTLTRSKFWRDC